MSKCSKVLLGLVIVEAIAIAVLIPLRLRFISYRSGPSSTYRNPLDEALRYESPPKKFEELVEHYQGWVNFKEPPNPYLGRSSSMSILTGCALGQLTNHVQILIEHGADTNEALTWCEKYGEKGAADLIRQVAIQGPSTSDLHK